MTDDRIDEAGHREAVKKIADETGAADHRARGDRRARIRKRKLEEPERQERNAGGFIGCRCALQEEPVIADEAIAVTEHERKAECVEQNAAQACVDDTLHQHVHGFARAAETGFQHREADLHAEYEKRRDQSPAVLTGLTTSDALTSGAPVCA